MCRLDPAPLASASAWLHGYERHWEERLDALEGLFRPAETEPTPNPNGRNDDPRDRRTGRRPPTLTKSGLGPNPYGRCTSAMTEKRFGYSCISAGGGSNRGAGDRYLITM